ncbi:MAG: lipase family protein [Cyanobacteria bacterium J06633_2]
MKLSRRTLLLAGLATASTARLTVDYHTMRTDHAQKAALEELARQQVDTQAMLRQAFMKEHDDLNEIQAIRSTIHLAQPIKPYQREMSKQLIQFNKLASEQYLNGKIDPAYDGAISTLPSYSDAMSAYTQIGTLIGKEVDITEEVEVTLPVSEFLKTASSIHAHTVSRDTNETSDTRLTDTVRKMIELRRTVPVYFGYVLASEHHSLILLRGTQRRIEWLTNLSVVQQPYHLYQDASVLDTSSDLNTTSSYGNVHVGFAAAYRDVFHTQLMELAQQLDPSLPCYVSGHSLGGALATMAVLDLALHLPKLRSHLHLYTFASPRVGDPTFANRHSQLIPNSYRITNVADTVPLVPPTKLGADYAHIGQPWSFLSQNGDVLPNHSIKAYGHAIKQELETQDLSDYRNLSII